jgi:DNA-binding XRE family transcriptional regulator
MGGPGSGPKPFSPRREQARRLRAGGLSLSGIARALGCTKQGVHYLLAGREPHGPRVPLRCTGCDRPLKALGLPSEAGLCLRCVRYAAAVGERLRAYRLAAGLSQRALGRQAGVSGGAVSEWERGLKRPRPSFLRRLAGALGVAPAKLDPPQVRGA